MTAHIGTALVVAAIGMGLGGCGPSKEAAALNDRMLADIVSVESAYRANVEGAACVAEFRRNMNDPASFQLATPLELDRIKTRVYYGDYMTRDLVGTDRVIIYSASERGRNAYGGLVLGNMSCYFTLNPAGGIRLLKAAEH